MFFQEATLKTYLPDAIDVNVESVRGFVEQHTLH